MKKTEKVLVIVTAVAILCSVLAVYLMVRFGSAVEKPYDYDLSEYIDLGNWQAVEAVYDDETVCTEEEIDDALFQVCLTWADFTPVEGRRVQQYDQVTVDYYCFIEGEPDDSLTQTGYDIICGLKNGSLFDEAIGEALVAQAPAAGDTVYADTAYPNEASYGGFAGCRVDIEIHVQKVSDHSIPECTDEFVRDVNGSETMTVAEFREDIRKSILEEKADLKAQKVWAAFYDQVTVKKYPEKEEAAYVAALREDFETDAENAGMTLDGYLQELGTDRATFENDILEQAHILLKQEMTFFQLARLEEVSLTEEEYQAGIRAYFESDPGEFSSLEAFEEEYGKEVLMQNLTWDRAIDILIANAVRVEG